MNTPTPTKRAVLYLRVSTRGQVDNDYDPEGISIPAQRAKAEKTAADLNAEIVEEYIEPGRTAKTVSNRPAFQQMMARIKAQHDVDYVIVYARSRMHRNTIDAAITKRDLRTAGAQMISIMDYTEDTAVGNMVATVLDAVNQYQSEASGADIAYKMGQKAMHGGTLGRAPIGYLNVRDHFEGREIRTVAVDPERAPFICLAFELYATGTHDYESIRDTLTDAGLRMKPTKRHPAGAQISIHKIGTMLQDRYYLGHITHKGVEYQGRHEPIIAPDLFNRVQEVLFNEHGAGIRARKHHHYLKGSIWCHRSKHRLVIMPGRSKNGTQYLYYMCRGRQDRTCDLPYLPIHDVEEAVAHHYATLAVPAQLRERITARMDAALADNSATGEALRIEIKKQLAKLDSREDQFLDLIGDPDWPREKIAKRLRAIRDERSTLEAKLSRSEHPDLDQGRTALTTVLNLLSNPHELYGTANETARRLLNQAFFTRLYIDADNADRTPDVSADDPTEPIAPLLHVQRRNGGVPKDTAVPQSSALLASALEEGCSSNTSWVELWGFEPQTSSMPWRRATNCAIAP